MGAEYSLRRRGEHPTPTRCTTFPSPGLRPRGISVGTSVVASRGTMKPALAAAAVVAVVAFPGAALAATPIPQNQSDLAALDVFTGKAAKPRPVAAPPVPRHPFMAANGRN